MTDTYKTTLVRIMGEDYPIKSDADSEYMRKLAKHVEDAIQNVSSRMKLPPHLKPEVLAALVIADAYFSEKEKNAEIERRLNHLVSVLEEGFDKDVMG
jgi:cell division protein ZapA (FtsZ GTPase activity inhibitor)